MDVVFSAWIVYECNMSGLWETVEVLKHLSGGTRMTAGSVIDWEGSKVLVDMR